MLSIATYEVARAISLERLERHQRTAVHLRRVGRTRWVRRRAEAAS